MYLYGKLEKSLILLYFIQLINVEIFSKAVNVFLEEFCTKNYEKTSLNFKKRTDARRM